METKQCPTCALHYVKVIQFSTWGNRWILLWCVKDQPFHLRCAECPLESLLLFSWNHLLSCSVATSCLTLCDPIDCSSPGFLVLHYLPGLLKLVSVESVTPSNHLILCRPLLLLPSIFPASRSFPMCRIFTSGDKNIILLVWEKL